MKRFVHPLMWLVCAGSVCASTTRVAIVDVGAQRAPPMFVDLLTVALAKESTIELLERAQVARLLREQAISMELSGTNAVKAGKLDVESHQTLRVRLVDARYGLKLWDTMFAVGATPIRSTAMKCSPVVSMSALCRMRSNGLLRMRGLWRIACHVAGSLTVSLTVVPF